jgi:capsular polysaccharide export protein
MALADLLSSKRVLMLQGPMGGFFSQLHDWFKEHQIDCHKVNFNGGDRLFFGGDEALDYRGQLIDFQAWLGETVKQLQIDTIVCFGDCRLYHIEAKEFCQRARVRFMVFEEGYLRPDYITLEMDGVNAFSGIHPSQIEKTPQAHDHPLPTNSSFLLVIWSACLYYLAWMVMHWRYPCYQHHRLLSPAQEVMAWFLALIRRVAYYLPDHAKQRYIRKHWKNRYYIVALQVHNDSQVRVHSDYNDVSEFIRETMTSFAAHALPDQYLVVKHHPMDRGYRNYGALIRAIAKDLGVGHRVKYVCDVHLPSLVRGSLGLIAINSTTGLQALFHSKPVKVMGRAIYDLPRLTSQCSLDQFWSHPERVDREYYLRFRELLLKQSQLNGSFYGDSPWMNRLTQHHVASSNQSSHPMPIVIRRNV